MCAKFATVAKMTHGESMKAISRYRKGKTMTRRKPKPICIYYHKFVNSRGRMLHKYWLQGTTDTGLYYRYPLSKAVAALLIGNGMEIINANSVPTPVG